MQYTKKDLKEQLYQMGLDGTETILIHSSMKAIGDVEGGAETVLDTWMEYFKGGLLLLPTHTWKTVNEDHPVFDSQKRAVLCRHFNQSFYEAGGCGAFPAPDTQHGRFRKKCGRIPCGRRIPQYAVYARRLLRPVKRHRRKILLVGWDMNETRTFTAWRKC